MASPTCSVLGVRALNRATLARQLLLGRAAMPAGGAVAHLLGLQAQNVKPPYYQLHARLAGFRPEELGRLMEERQVVRMVTMRSTIHAHTVQDARTLRPLVQGARDREVGYFRKGLAGVDPGALAGRARGFVEEEPRTMGEIREELLRQWPGADPQALAVAARCLLPLVQVTPRGVWGRGGQVRLTTLERWTGEGEGETEGEGMDGLVLRYLAAFGPASVKDMQTWAGLTRLRGVFEGLRPRLVTFRDENGVELFDLPDAPRPDPGTPAPPRFLPEFDNLLLSHADRARVVPPEFKGRNTSGNQSRCVLMTDGFLGGVWAAAGGAVTVELFRETAAAVKEEIVAEGEAMLAALGDGPGKVRFGSVRG
ncbi:winged helix DNA-binding domain-containing protein [Streptomyces sp. NPDC001546]|uniref:winged helix DNA-binding domain-containing protein n=1 Tax=Streptomyces sp. NPDC001546 TaxID=3364585 RepID=UPI0036A123C2